MSPIENNQSNKLLLACRLAIFSVWHCMTRAWLSKCLRKIEAVLRWWHVYDNSCIFRWLLNRNALSQLEHENLLSFDPSLELSCSIVMFVVTFCGTAEVLRDPQRFFQLPGTFHCKLIICPRPELARIWTLGFLLLMLAVHKFTTKSIIHQSL